MPLNVDFNGNLGTKIYNVATGTKPNYSGTLTVWTPEEVRDEIKSMLAPLERKVENAEKVESEVVTRLDNRLSEEVRKYLPKAMKDELKAEIEKEIDVRLQRRLSEFETRLLEIERKNLNG